MMSFLFLCLILMFLSETYTKHMITPEEYCTVDITVGIDFSSDMQTIENIETLVNFVVYNFSYSLPFMTTNVTISLLTYGTNGINISSPLDNYEDFKNLTLSRFYDVKKTTALQASNLTEVLNHYQSHLNQYLRPDVPAKLVLFTAVNNRSNINDAKKVAIEIKNMTNPACLKGQTDFHCNKIVIVGINQTSASLYDLGNWIFLTSFDDYTWYTGDNNFADESIDKLVQISMNEFLMVMCTQVINVDKFECGSGYCEESICTGEENGCYNYLACVEDQCIYWDVSVKTWGESKEICQLARASLIVIENESFQKELYEIFGDGEYWLSLNSIGNCAASDWSWILQNGTQVSLQQINYTNWGQGQPAWIDNNPGCSCIFDDQKDRWQSANCHKDIKFIACMKTASIPTSENNSPGDSSPTIVKIVIVFVASLGAIFMIFAIIICMWKFIESYCMPNIPSSSSSSTESPENATTATILSMPDNQTATPDSLTVENFDINSKTSANLSSKSFELKIINETSSEIQIDLEMFENLNILIFPSIEKPFSFKINDLIERYCIEASQRHVVKAYFHEPSEQILAVKFVTIPRSQHQNEITKRRLQSLLREIENFRTLWKHSNIVDFYGICKNEGQALICMELMDMSLADLYDKVHRAADKFPENFVGYITVKILDAMQFCKSNKIMHRDIKPNNILVNFSGEIKLCDFGESRILENSLASTHVGTVTYWPPEFIVGYQNFIQNDDIDDKHYDIRTDIWSLGITISEVIIGRLPYLDGPIDSEEDQNKDPNKRLSSIVFSIATTNFEGVIDDEIRPNYSDSLCGFLKLCLQTIDKRPKLDGLIVDEFYTSNNAKQSLQHVREFCEKFKS